MTPELRMAQILSSDDEKQKIANDLTKLSIEELGVLLHGSDEVSNPEPEEAALDATTEEKVAMADEWGRELANKEKKASTMGNVSEGSKILRRASDLWTRHGPAIKNVAGNAGKGAVNAVKAVGERIGKIENPIPRGAAAGATIGGVAGGIQGLVSPDRDPYTGEKKRIKTMLTKGTAGAMTGAATGALTGAMQKSSSVQKLEEAMTKRAAGVLGGGGFGTMARNFVASARPIAQKALEGSTMGRAAGVGAAAGGALGAAKGLVAPGRDSQGRSNSRIGGALRGAAGGAVGGAALGAGAKGLSTLKR